MEPSVFISYSHADKAVAIAIAVRLVELGARVWIDEGELRVGDSIIERIGTAIAEVHFVVAIVSASSIGSQWCQKELSLAITGGLQREGVKVLPLRLGDVEMPPTLKDLLYLSIDPNDPAAVAPRLFQDAQAHMANPRAQEGLGPTPQDLRDSRGPIRRSAISPTSSSNSMAAAGPIRLVGIVREGIGVPRGDGTRGSALYAVPFRLSRVPTREWASRLVATWDRPPTWTTMHRPGIARVTGDVVTLDGVTMQEIERYHLDTLKLCVHHVNAEITQQEARRAADEQRDRERKDQHEASVDETLRRLNFADEESS